MMARRHTHGRRHALTTAKGGSGVSTASTRVLRALVALGVLIAVAFSLSPSSSHGDTLGAMDGGLGAERELLSTATSYAEDLCTSDFHTNGGIVLLVVVVIYCFAGLSIISEDYFVPSLGSISERFGLSEDVAGATFMAAGSSAPEFFASLLSTFSSSGGDLGVGTIVGSALFNVLVIVGTVALLAGKPLALDWRPLARDSAFYSVSIIGMAASFIDGEVSWWEALLLLGLYVLYVLFMAVNSRIINAFCAPNVTMVEEMEAGRGSVGGGGGEIPTLGVVPSVSGEKPEPHTTAFGPPVGDSLPAGGRKMSRSSSIAGMSSGSSARLHRSGSTFNSPVTRMISLRASATALMSSSKLSKGVQSHNRRASQIAHDTTTSPHSSAPQVSPKSSVAPPDLEGGGDPSTALNRRHTVSLPSFAGAGGNFESSSSIIKPTSPTTPEVSSLSTTDTVTASSQEEETLLAESSVVVEGGSGKPMASLEPYEGEDALDDTLGGSDSEMEGSIDDEETGSMDHLPIPDNFKGWVLFILIAPFFYVFKYTVPDCSIGRGREHLYMVTFVLSILWIGALSYAMVESATHIGCIVELPPAVMGLTVLAAGTSTPDALASVLVAKEGLADMAVSSALGSNVFDILIALGVPWLLKSLIDGSPVAVDSDGIAVSVAILFAVLVLFVAILLFSKWVLHPRVGYGLIAIYFAFVIYSLVSTYA